jgi:hypothetical protein
MGKLKLTVNEEKTRICKVPEATRSRPAPLAALARHSRLQIP